MPLTVEDVLEFFGKKVLGVFVFYSESAGVQGPRAGKLEALPCPRPWTGIMSGLPGVACSSFTRGIWWEDREE